ncbi:hypothetical protein DAPPUDRAFT_253529 [Daphnia pulex]|uniref:LRAT domain-containing protein n=1 Tax=Daphnia pulex TaxID=6669 RepID=E9H526_DAPPU|nr:hypothetical protein DAPPUDRAFT_253529 [Daphnia pulex]|eukprot:EFX73255.1 hypothetical protein DAPPUDRAFT_253529 [Daphnia pulex]
MDLWYPPDEIIANKGDLIVFQRHLKKMPYLHYAVCTVSPAANPQAIVDQNGDRITVGVDTPQLLIFTQIVEKTIRNQCNEHGGRVNNLDEAARAKDLFPLPPDVIVERARQFLRQRLIYNVFTKNCEHFATKCRYEEGFSLQVSVHTEVYWDMESIHLQLIRTEHSPLPSLLISFGIIWTDVAHGIDWALSVRYTDCQDVPQNI